LYLYREHPGKGRVGLHSENLLLRSCTVRNTETVIGIVVYAGHFHIKRYDEIVEK